MPTQSVQCGARAAWCVCSLPPHDDETPHHCQAPNCGGQWRGSLGDDSFDIVRMMSEHPPVGAIFGYLVERCQ